MKKAALILLALAAAACGGSTSAPSTVAANATVSNDVFTGVVQVGGLDVHNFTVTTPGTVSVTMTAAGPPPTITMGIGIGNPNGAGGCTFISTTQLPASTTTPQLSGTLTASGPYCVGIGDVGNAAGPITYSVTVSHT
ncbi:MAG TPA: hypothetical protein VN628_12810 [Vicinamibacterales bacterium]|nr:hypothetical protein [Vicinamibacterales bacterium]